MILRILCLFVILITPAVAQQQETIRFHSMSKLVADLAIGYEACSVSKETLEKQVKELQAELAKLKEAPK